MPCDHSPTVQISKVVTISKVQLCVNFFLLIVHHIENHVYLCTLSLFWIDIDNPLYCLVVLVAKFFL